jgi:hypothetical protein
MTSILMNAFLISNEKLDASVMGRKVKSFTEMVI